MPTLIGSLSASLLRLTTTPDGRSSLPNWIVTALATFAETELPKSKKPGSIDESLVWRAVTMYQSASRRLGQPDAQVGWQKAPDSAFAVQVLPPPQSDVQRRALAELESLVQSTTINHPGLAPVIRTAFNQGYPYLAARLSQGAESITKRFGLPMDPNQALQITEQVASALEYAHYRGLVHGSLSLDDILVGANGQFSVLGVGVNQLQQLLGALPASTSNALTPPEVQAGKAPDARTDVFAVGALLFVLLTGKMPSLGKPVALSQDIPAISPAIDEVLTKALAADPTERYADLFEMSAALRVATRSYRPAARPAPITQRAGKAEPAPVRPATQSGATPAPQSGFPEALPMPEIDIAVFNQPLNMPEIAQAVAVAMPSPPPIPAVDWDSLLRPIDLSAFGGLAIEIPIDQGQTAPPDPMLAAVQAVRSVENKPSKTGRSKAPTQHPTAVSSQKSEQAAQPPQAQPTSARRARKRKSPK